LVISKSTRAQIAVLRRRTNIKRPNVRESSKRVGSQVEEELGKELRGTETANDVVDLVQEIS